MPFAFRVSFAFETTKRSIRSRQSTRCGGFMKDSSSAKLAHNTFISAPPKDLLLDGGFGFTHGETIAPFSIRYETFGELNADRSNAILVCHALSANAHAAGT